VIVTAMAVPATHPISPEAIVVTTDRRRIPRSRRETDASTMIAGRAMSTCQVRLTPSGRPQVADRFAEGGDAPHLDAGCQGVTHLVLGDQQQ